MDVILIALKEGAAARKVSHCSLPLCLDDLLGFVVSVLRASRPVE